MKKIEYNENNVSGSAKFPIVISLYVNNNKTKNNSCNGEIAAIIFYQVYFFSKLNELREDESVYINGRYYVRLTSVKLYKWFKGSNNRQTLYRALNVLVNMGLIDCIKDGNMYGSAYCISDFGLKLVEKDKNWLDGDVYYFYNNSYNKNKKISKLNYADENFCDLDNIIKKFN